MNAFHRWYSSVMGFSPSFVAGAINELGCDASGYLLDPFCGTGTTLVESKLAGIPSIGIDANPFSAFCTRAKTNWSVPSKELWKTGSEILEKADHRYHKVLTGNAPHVVQNGWVTKRIWAHGRAYLESAKQIRDTEKRELLELAALAAVKEFCANVAFGPEIYRRKRKAYIPFKRAVGFKLRQFTDDLDTCSNKTPAICTQVHHGDSRNLNLLADLKGAIKWVISSPPYPTEHDYSRIARIELELGGFVSSDIDLHQVKRMQIRSNSKTVYSNDTDWKFVDDLKSVSDIVSQLRELAKSKNYSFAKRYPMVVGNYFGGLHQHLLSLAEIMPAGGKCLYVLGEQRSYLGVLVPTTDIFIEIACEQIRAFNLQKRTVLKLRRGTKGTTEAVREEAIILVRR